MNGNIWPDRLGVYIGSLADHNCFSKLPVGNDVFITNMDS